MTDSKKLPEAVLDHRDRFWLSVEVRGLDECWEWKGKPQKFSYPRFGFERKKVLASHVAYLLTRGEDPHPLNVLHSCDNSMCVNPCHLRRGTLAENNRERAARGRSATGDRHGSRTCPESRPRGEKHPGAKLTPSRIAEAREIYDKGGVSLRKLASGYGVSHAALLSAFRRKTWKNL